MIDMTRDEMIQHLRKQTVRVVFKKVNGEERDMMCTLGEEFIPTEHRPTSAATTYNEEVVRVYDVNAAGWRSFRVENVVSFSV